jgi:hypothetical protein
MLDDPAVVGVAARTSRRPTGGGWVAEGTGPVRGLPADFRLLRPLWPGDDERRWVSLTRRALLVEMPGPEGRVVVALRAFRTWPALVAACLAELPETAHPAATAALLAPWWADR